MCECNVKSFHDLTMEFDPSITHRLDASAVPDEIYERSGVQLGGQRWHVAQRPIGGGESGAGGVGMIVYAIWNMADPARAAEARAALKGGA